jgi:hypothetical protein
MQVSIRILIGIISFCIATTGTIVANMLLIMMIGEINRKREEGNLVSYFGYTFPKILQIHREYRNLYPNGKLHIYELTSFALAMISAISLAVCLRIIG